jgi:hypothetical protein
MTADREYPFNCDHCENDCESTEEVLIGNNDVEFWCSDCIDIAAKTTRGIHRQVTDY